MSKDSTYLSAFADLNWNDISDADLAMFNMVPPVPSPAISTPTLNVNSNPLANLVSPPPPSTTLPSSLPNCRDNLLYQMQDNGSSVVPSIPRPTTLAPKLRPLSISSENLSRSNRRNRNKHHLIDLNSNLPDTNANVEQERVANSKKEQVLQLFKMNSPEQAGGVVHGRSQSLTTTTLPTELTFRYNPLYSNLLRNSNFPNQSFPTSSKPSLSYLANNNNYYNVMNQSQQLPSTSQQPGPAQAYPLSPILSPTMPPNASGFNYFQLAQNYVNLNQQLINQINNSRKQNNENGSASNGAKREELLTPTSTFVPQSSSQHIIDLFDPLVQNDKLKENEKKNVEVEPVSKISSHSYVNVNELEFTQQTNQSDDAKNNNDNKPTDQNELNQLMERFKVTKRDCIASYLTEYCDHLKALYLSFFSKSNSLINSGLVFSPRIEINPDKQNLDHQQLNQLYFYSSSNTDATNEIHYLTTGGNSLPEADQAQEINEAILDIRFHVQVFEKLTGCDSSSLDPSSTRINRLESNYNWFSFKFCTDMEKTVDMIISQVVYHVADSVPRSTENVQINIDNYLLKVKGYNEFLLPKSQLSSYVYVQKCKQTNLDVVLELIDQTAPEFWRPFLRSDVDTEHILDNACSEKILPIDTVNNFQSNNSQQVNRVIERLQLSYATFSSMFNNLASLKDKPSLFKDILYRIDELCEVLSNIRTSTLNRAIARLQSWYDHFVQIADNPNVSARQQTVKLNSALALIIKELIHIIEMYANAFPVDFRLIRTTEKPSAKHKVDITKNVGLFTIHVDVCAQIPKELLGQYSSFALYVSVFHGLNMLDFCTTRQMQPESCESKTSIRIMFDQALKFKFLTSTLPRETRVEFILVGFSNCPGKASAVASTFFYLYDQENILRSESHILPFTLFDPVKSFTVYPERPTRPQNLDSFLVSHNLDPEAIMLVMSLDDIPDDVHYVFPEISKRSVHQNSFSLDVVVPLDNSVIFSNDDCLYGFHGYNIDQLSQRNRPEIIDIIQRNPLEPINQMECDLIWDNRNTLINFPGAILKILKAPPTWSHHDLPIIYQLLDQFEYSPVKQGNLSKLPFMTTVETLQLLSFDYPDQNVRRLAIRWLKTISIDELCDYLPQLVQALRYEPSIDSHLIWLLFEFSLISARFCHFFYWQLKSCTSDSSFGFRCRLYLNSLLVLCGERARSQFFKQEKLCSELAKVCAKIKESRDPKKDLCINLGEINKYINSNPLAIPLSPSAHVCGLDVNKCSYFNSNSMPLKVVFQEAPPYQLDYKSQLDTFVSHIHNKNPLYSIYENRNRFHKIIFKCGDDLRQDMLVMQVISIINRIWLRSGKDLRLIIFGVLNNSDRTGMIEMVSRAQTLREIQQEYGVIGSFKQDTIVKWLKRYNPNEFDYQMAFENFIHSCAGYVVITYLLGICDRHNDNIMVTTTGNLFHIDFGKFLGDAQMMAGFKRDRAPFVFTADMAFVINEGDKPSKNYQFFVELCCDCFTLVRKNGNFLLSLLSMMIPSGIYGLSQETIKYFHKALMPDMTDSQARSKFNRLIEKALNSFATQFNFFIHSIAQLKFNNSSNNSSPDALYAYQLPGKSRSDSDASVLNQHQNTDVPATEELTSLEDSCVFSFVKKRFTQSTDGYITNLEIVDIWKNVEKQEKVYYFKIKVDYKQFPETFVYRSYKEFVELYERLSRTFPLARFHRLVRSPILPRFNRDEIAFQRRSEIRSFLINLKSHADEISHSDIVYTFFHPILRDSDFAESQQQRRSGIPSPKGKAKIKLSFCYRDNGLNVLVCLVRNLPERGSAPDTYVKLYLMPDQAKLTKKKTRVINRNCHPIFMENIFYPCTKSELRSKILDVSVWSTDKVSLSNSCLGRTEVPLKEYDLSTQTESWFPLKIEN